MKPRMIPGWVASVLVALPVTLAAASADIPREGVRRDPLVGPHPNALRESDRPLMGEDRTDRWITKESPRSRANSTATAPGETTDRLERRVRSGSPRGEATWGRR